VVDADDLTTWEAAEFAHAIAERDRAVRVRVLGYLELCSRRVEQAGAELERRVTLLCRARADAERALEALRSELREAEEAARIVSQGSRETVAALADALSTFESDESEVAA
jgi:hypothetical protein